MKNAVCLFSLIVLNLLSILIIKAQNTNAFKYWYYRDRLEYFVMPGTQAGQSIVAGIRNQPWGSYYGINMRDNIDFGQAYTRMGFYLGVLATEYRLFKDNLMLDELPPIINEISLALGALIRTDMHESGPPWSFILDNPQDYWDGFFVREDVPPLFTAQYNAEDHLHHFNKDLTDDNIVDLLQIGYFGKPAKIVYDKIACINAMYNEEDCEFYNYQQKWNFVGDNNWLKEYKTQTFNSHDEVIGVLIGLALVYKLVDEPSIKQTTSEIADRLTSFMYQHPRCNFALFWKSYFPDCVEMGVVNGGEHAVFSVPLNKTRMLFDLPIFPFPDPVLSNTLWAFAIANAEAFSDESNRLMVSQLLCLSDYSPPIAYFTQTFLAQPRYALKAITDSYNWDTFYILVYSILHDKDPNILFNMNNLIDQIDIAPCGGTFNYGFYSNIQAGLFYPNANVVGWASENKFTHDIQQQNLGQSGFPGTFHGLDFMLLYNLASICFPNSFSPFLNLRNRNISIDFPWTPSTTIPLEFGSHVYPLCIKAINSISSNSSIDADGNVTFIAGAFIDLLPGFETEQGSEFTAKLESYSCNGLPYKNSSLVPWDNFNLKTAYDSVISTPSYANKIYMPEDYFRKDVYGNFFAESNEKNTLNIGNFSCFCYPNPANDLIYVSIQSDSEGCFFIEIIDIQGKQCITKTFDNFNSGNNETSIQINNLDLGVYAIKVHHKGDFKTLRFVKF